MDPTLNLVEFQFKGEETLSFLRSHFPVTPRTKIRLGFIAKTLLHRVKNPLLGFHNCRLSPKHPLPDRISVAEWAKYGPNFSKIRALLANGLTVVDLVRCWVAWRIIPLSCRPDLMCNYTCDVKDPQRYNQTRLEDQEINEMTNSLLVETLESCSEMGLNPFCALNPTLDISILSHSFNSLITFS